MLDQRWINAIDSITRINDTLRVFNVYYNVDVYMSLTYITGTWHAT